MFANARPNDWYSFGEFCPSRVWPNAAKHGPSPISAESRSADICRCGPTVVQIRPRTTNLGRNRSLFVRLGQRAVEFGPPSANFRPTFCQRRPELAEFRPLSAVACLSMDAAMVRLELPPGEAHFGLPVGQRRKHGRGRCAVGGAGPRSPDRSGQRSKRIPAGPRIAHACPMRADPHVFPRAQFPAVTTPQNVSLHGPHSGHLGRWSCNPAWN